MFQMGPPKRNEDLGLLAHMCVTVVFGGAFPEEAQVPRTLLRTVGQHGELVSEASNSTASGAERFCEQKTSRQYGAKS